jgi:hypothetical protein
VPISWVVTVEAGAGGVGCHAVVLQNEDCLRHLPFTSLVRKNLSSVEASLWPDDAFPARSRASLLSHLAVKSCLRGEDLILCLCMCVYRRRRGVTAPQPSLSQTPGDLHALQPVPNNAQDGKCRVALDASSPTRIRYCIAPPLSRVQASCPAMHAPSCLGWRVVVEPR